MPKVNGKKFPYTKKGKADAVKAKKTKKMANGGVVKGSMGSASNRKDEPKTDGGMTPGPKGKMSMSIRDRIMAKMKNRKKK